MSLGRTQSPPLSIPSEIFSVYQPAIGHIATLLWLNLRWAVQTGASLHIERAPSMGLHISEDEWLQAVERLRAYELLEDGQGGAWIVHDPLPAELFRLRFEEGRSRSEGTALPSAASMVGSVQAVAPPQQPLPLQPEPTPSTSRPGAGGKSGAGAAEKTPRRENAARVMRSPLSKKRVQDRMLKLVDENIGDSDAVNEDMQAVLQIYHKRIGMIGPTQFEKLRFWVEEQGMEGAVVALAIEETVCSAEVPRISYLEGILRNWHNDGIRTLTHVQERKRASKVFSGPGGATPKGHEGAPNASAYQSVSPEMVAKWKELYPDEYDS